LSTLLARTEHHIDDDAGSEFSKLHHIFEQAISITAAPRRRLAAIAIPMKHGNPMTSVYQFPRERRSNETISPDKQNAHNQSYLELWFAVPKVERLASQIRRFQG
jgi:hypothetical protein